MKKLLLVLTLFLSLNVMANNIYCPQLIACKNKVCDGLPNNFKISNQWGNIPSTVIFYFDKATSIQIMQEHFCNYEENSHKAGIVITSIHSIKANTNAPNNNWFDIADKQWGGVFYCQVNARHCPFMDY